jgi:hypothetical protein
MIRTASALNRRQWLASMASVTACGWLPGLVAATAQHPARQRSCIMLWLNGGPATIDLFDLKPGNANGGPFQPIATRSAGVQISEHLPTLAKWSERTALVRSLRTKEGDHGRARFLASTGNVPLGAILFPAFGACVAKELGSVEGQLPSFISIARPRNQGGNLSAGAGFLGPAYAPLLVGEGASERRGGSADELTVPNLARLTSVSAAEQAARVDLLADLDERFAVGRDVPQTAGQRTAYRRAVRLMTPEAAQAFDFLSETAATRERYGRDLFGQACLLARRLVERDVPFVEVTLDGWDTHQDNFTRVRELSGILDRAVGALLTDLHDRGLLERTLIVCMGEFGRTPKINVNTGRDHYPAAWSAFLAGGGIRGGQAYGTTSPDGLTVTSQPTSIPDLLATICTALGIDPEKQNMSNVGRPIRIADPSAQPITEILA